MSEKKIYIFLLIFKFLLVINYMVFNQDLYCLICMVSQCGWLVRRPWRVKECGEGIDE